MAPFCFHTGRNHVYSWSIVSLTTQKPNHFTHQGIISLWERVKYSADLLLTGSRVTIWAHFLITQLRYAMQEHFSKRQKTMLMYVLWIVFNLFFKFSFHCYVPFFSLQIFSPYSAQNCGILPAECLLPKIVKHGGNLWRVQSNTTRPVAKNAAPELPAGKRIRNPANLVQVLGKIELRRPWQRV